jgi:hypothetical protein
VQRVKGPRFAELGKEMSFRGGRDLGGGRERGDGDVSYGRIG